MKTSIVFFGTQQFAARILLSLIECNLFDVTLVITQPDRPSGRKQVLTESPVKQVAESKHLAIAQPESLRDFQIPTSEFELGVVAQYGLIIPKHILAAPKFGIINVHTSLLPKYRGASPIQSALINGELETGVTIMRMEAGLDTGPIILQKKLLIEFNDTYSTLDDKLAKLGCSALLEAIPGYLSGLIPAVPQDNTLATNCRQLTREDGKIDWQKTNTQIYNQYRGLTPWPGIWTLWNGRRLKLLSIQPVNQSVSPGIVVFQDDKMLIGCGSGSIEVLELQLEGKITMNNKTFLNGHKEIVGQTLQG